MFCSKCGKRIPDDANFCNFCGTKVEIFKEGEDAITQCENNTSEIDSLEENTKIDDISNTIVEDLTIEVNSVDISSQSESISAEHNPQDSSEPEKTKTIDSNQHIPENSNSKEKNSSHSWFYSLLVIGLIFAGIKTCQYQMQKKANEGVMRYVEREYGSLENVVAGKHEGSHPINNSSQSNSSYSQENEFRKLMQETADDCNNDCPESIGPGMKMTKCELKDKTLMYTIVWDGVRKSDITNDLISDMRQSYKDGIKEQYKESNVLEKQMLDKMKQYDYKYGYHWVNNEGQDLFTVTVPIEF